MSKRKNRANNQTPINTTIKSIGGSGMFNDPNSARFFGSTMASSGVPVTTQTALGVPAVYAANRAISEDTAKMNFGPYKRNGTGFLPYTEHPLTDVFENPNEWMTAYDLKAFVAASHALRGNSYTVIVRDNAGITPKSLIPVNPDVCNPIMQPDGRIVYVISHPLVADGAAVYVRAEDVLHTRGYSLNGWIGISPITVMAEAIGVSIATQQHAAKLFGQGAAVLGVLEYPGALTPESAQRLAESWRNAYTGTQQAHKTAVLEEGGKFTKIGLSAEEAQFLETRKFQLGDICRAFRIPPHKVLDLGDAHYANLESMQMQYVNDTLRPFGDRFEQQCNQKLLTQAERKLGISLRFDYDSIQRDTTDVRYKNYAIGKQNGWLTRNMILASEGLPTSGPEGDVFMESLAVAPADNGDKEDPNKVPPTGTASSDPE